MSKNLLQLHNGSKSFGLKKIFQQANFSVNDDEHIGVIGANGAGKSTLFNILTDKDHLDDGDVIKSNELRIGFLEQEVTWEDGETLEDYLAPCIKPIWELKSLGRQLGLFEPHFSQPINSFSGGYRMRCKLLYLLGFDPNLMLLDEPTNYLDLETVLILERFLQNYQGSFLLISHDREFLRRTTDHTLEIEDGEITKYNGQIDDYFEQKELLREQLIKSAVAQDKKAKVIQAFIDRFGAKATKAKQAQSKLKTLNKMEKIEIRALPVKSAIQLPEPVSTGKVVVECEDVSLGYDSKLILNNVNLTIERGDHIAVIGYNGAGKSTLLKAIAGKLPPISGGIELGLRVECAYYGQHVADELVLTRTVYEELQADSHKDVIQQDILNLAGSLLFSGKDVEKKIQSLSGGEKARVALGKVILKRQPLIILDEPTNHLDFNTVESLTQSLNKYNGTIVLVSHDRSFVSRVAKKIVEVKDGRVLSYPGTYDEYVWSVSQENNFDLTAKPTLNSIETTLSDSSTTQKSNSITKKDHQTPKLSFGELKQQQRDLERSIRKLRTLIEKTELNIQSSQKLIEDLTMQLEAEPERAIELGETLKNKQDELDSNEERCLELMEELEAKESEYVTLIGDGV